MLIFVIVFFFKQKTAYEMRISDWSSDVCSSDLCFYSVMGLVKPDHGRIFLDGTDITDLPMYRRAVLGLGYLPQETSIFRGMTVEQNIMAVLEISEEDSVKRQERLNQLDRKSTRLNSSH